MDLSFDDEWWWLAFEELDSWFASDELECLLWCPDDMPDPCIEFDCTVWLDDFRDDALVMEADGDEVADDADTLAAAAAAAAAAACMANISFWNDDELYDDL